MRIRFLACWTLLACLFGPPAAGEVIYDYQGAFFTDVFPSLGGVDLTTSDRISGRFVFDDVDSTSAKSIQLSITVGGTPGWEFDIPDTANTGAFTIVNNSVTFSGTDIVAWNVEILGEAFGQPGDTESLWISESFGDLASIDFGGFLQSTAFTSTPGVFTEVVVPEPSALLMLTLGTAAIGWRVRRRKRGKSVARSCST